jgi:FtsH-binding integral membrane protein
MSILIFAGGIMKKGKKGGISGEDALLEDILKKVDIDVIAEHQGKGAKLSPEEKKRRFFDAVYWILGFVLLIFLFGFLIAIPLFTVSFMRAKKESWVLSLSCAAGLWVGVYIAFIKLSQSTIYEGIILQLLGE